MTKHLETSKNSRIQWYMFTLTGGDFLIVRVEECFNFSFAVSSPRDCTFFPLTLLFEFTGIFIQKKPRGGGEWKVTFLR